MQELYYLGPEHLHFRALPQEVVECTWGLATHGATVWLIWLVLGDFEQSEIRSVHYKDLIEQSNSLGETNLQVCKASLHSSSSWQPTRTPHFLRLPIATKEPILICLVNMKELRQLGHKIIHIKVGQGCSCKVGRVFKFMPRELVSNVTQDKRLQ